MTKGPPGPRPKPKPRPKIIHYSDNELRAMWRDAGGFFHGPNIETGTMEEKALLRFMRLLINGRLKQR